jgi:hypothetical protein
MQDQLLSLAPDLGNWEVLRNVLGAATIIAVADARGESFSLVNEELGYHVTATIVGHNSFAVNVVRLDGKSFYAPATKYPGEGGITPMLSAWREIPASPELANDTAPIPIRRGKK